MYTEIGTIKAHANPVESRASSYEDGPHAIIFPQLESENASTDKQNNSCGESSSLLNASPQPQGARKVIVKTTESLGDWGVVVCVFLSNLIYAVDFTGFAVFYPFLVEHFEATTAAVGWCASLHGFFQSAIALFASYPIKSYGCRLPGVVGCLLVSLGLSLSYLAPNLTMIYFTYGVIAGSGSGLAILSTDIIIHQRFTRNRKLASGIGSIGFSCGSMAGSFIANYILVSYGWRGAFLLLGAIQVQRILPCMFFRTPNNLTEQSKYPPETFNSWRMSCRLILKYAQETFNFSILRHARYSTYAVASILHVFCVNGYWSHTLNRAVNVGLTRDQGAIAAAIIGGTATVTRVPVSFIANHPKVKSSLIFATGMFFAFLSIVAMFIDPEVNGTMTSAVLFGLHMGCTTTVFSVVAVELMGVALLAKSLAMLQFTGGFAKLAAAPLIGWVFDVTRDYNKAFAIIGCAAFVSASLMVVLTFVARCHQKPVSKGI